MEEKRKEIFAYHTSLNDGVSGSCHSINCVFPSGVTKTYLTDVGLFMGDDLKTRDEESDELNETFPFKVDKIDGVFITHVHMDHCGRLPLLCKLGYNKPIYCTKASAALLVHGLADCCRLLAARDKELYEMVDVETALSLIKVVDFNETFSLFDDNESSVQATFFMNGHLLGAAMILIQLSHRGSETVNLFYTGDYKKESLFFKSDKLPSWVRNLPLTFICESTYGSTDITDVVEKFEKDIRAAVLKSAKIVIPCIALGRTEVVLYHLYKMQQLRLLPDDIPINLVGRLATSYFNIYHNRSDLGLDETKKVVPENFHIIRKDENIYQNESGASITLVTPGMMTGGNSLRYAFECVSASPRNLVEFTSYLPEGGIAEELLNTPKNCELMLRSGLHCSVIGDVKQTSEFSSHAKRDELLELLSEFKNIKCLLITHGSPEVRKIFADSVRNNPDLTIENVEISSRDYVYRIDSTGISKKFPSKIDQLSYDNTNGQLHVHALDANNSHKRNYKHYNHEATQKRPHYKKHKY